MGRCTSLGLLNHSFDIHLNYLEPVPVFLHPEYLRVHDQQYLQQALQQQHPLFTKTADRIQSLTSVLWPPHVKNQLIGKDPDAGKD